MSIKQYNISSLHPHIIEDKNGFMIYYEDYAELKAFSDEAQAHIAKEERKSRERLDMEQAENARLKAEVERLEKTEEYLQNTLNQYALDDMRLTAELARLQAEVERLRKAGDDMYSWLGVCGRRNSVSDDWLRAKKGLPSLAKQWEREKENRAWNAAKQGKPSV